MTELSKGHCLCGAVSVNVSELSSKFGACHCDMCRRWSGGPYLSVDCGVDVSMDGEESITTYSSSSWADRGFCKQCGSHLFYRLKESGQYFMAAGLFSNIDFIFDHQVFIDEKPTYYCFSNKTIDMTGAEAFAQYGSSNKD